MKYQIQSKKGLRIVELNRRRAIRECCLNCTGWIPKEVTGCDLAGCHLHEFRTGIGKQNPVHRKKAIRKYCLSCMNGQRIEVKLCTSPDCPLFAYRLGNVDRTAEIKSLHKSGHIEPVFEDKSMNQYPGKGEPFLTQDYQILTGAGIGSCEKMVLCPWQNHRSTKSRVINGNGKRAGASKN